MGDWLAFKGKVSLLTCVLQCKLATSNNNALPLSYVALIVIYRKRLWRTKIYSLFGLGLPLPSIAISQAGLDNANQHTCAARFDLVQIRSDTSMVSVSDFESPSTSIRTQSREVQAKLQLYLNGQYNPKEGHAC
jgi:hypothetical protein